MAEQYEKVTKFDLYNIKLTRKEAYNLFLANEETDPSILPLPLNAEEEELYAACLEHSQDKVACKADASNVGANLGEDNDNSEDWGDALGGGEIASGEKRLVTGDTVYNEVRPETDGEYVKTANTTAENLSALDAKTKELADAVDLINSLDGTATRYKALMKNFFEENLPENYTSAQLTAVCDLWYDKIKVEWDGYVEYTAPTLSDTGNGTKGGNNAGMSCTPSTNETANTDDYAGHPFFAPTNCNWKVDATTLEPVITAIEGITSNYENDNPQKLVGVLQQSGYTYTVENSAVIRKGYTAKFKPYANIKPLPESVRPSNNKMRPWVVHSKYLNHTVDGKLTSYSGVIPTSFISHNGTHTLASATGTGYSGMCYCDWEFIRLMYEIKYAKQYADGVLQGCLSNNITGKAAVSETGVKRILLSGTPAFEKGMGVMVGAINASGTEISRSETNYNISGSGGCIVTKVESVTVSDTTYTAVYVDTEETFDTVAGTTCIATWHWPNGSCDNVLGNDGSPGNPASGKYPAKIQGIEFMLGGYEVLADTIAKYYKDSSDNYKMQLYFAERTAHQSTGVTENYKASGVEIDQPASSAWTYFSHMGRGRGGVSIPDTFAGSSSQHYKDAWYLLAATVGEKEVICFGFLDRSAPNYGLSCANCHLALTNGTWHYVSRPSPNGNSGEFVAE